MGTRSVVRFTVEEGISLHQDDVETLREIERLLRADRLTAWPCGEIRSRRDEPAE
jgi:hypothetical protein